MEREPVAFGSGNVFEDLGVADTEEHLAKADLVSKIASAVEERGLSEAEMAGIIGISQSEAALLLRGRCRDFSTDRLGDLLNRLEITLA